MNRKLILLVLILPAVVLPGIGVAVYYLGGEPPVQKKKPLEIGKGPLRGKWHEVRGAGDKELSAEQKTKMEQLESLSYLSGYQEAPDKSGVTVNTEAAQQGYNLVLSGHGPEAMLMDMAGKTLHVWRISYKNARKDFPALRKPIKGFGPFTFRRAHLFDNGDLLAIYEGFGLVKMDKNSKLLWVFPRAAHHDLSVDASGEIRVLSRRARVVERLDPKEPALLDYVSWLSPEGELIKDLSLLEAFEISKFAPLLKGMPMTGDIFHTNAIKVLDGSHAAKGEIFTRGHLLISVLHLDTIAIVDPKKREVVWAKQGSWKKQHEPVLLKNGNMLLFDNNKGGEHSRVLEMDPMTLKVFWSYEGGKDGIFYSAECGVVQRLDNGNTLITESLNGRAFEVTPAKKIVWEYYNPYRAGNEAQLIATLFDVVRVRADIPVFWLE